MGRVVKAPDVRATSPGTGEDRSHIACFDFMLSYLVSAAGFGEVKTQLGGI